jgi:copper chaperone
MTMHRQRWAVACLVAVVGVLSPTHVLQAESGTTSPTASATLAVKKLSVNGMTCFGCVQAVEAALKGVAGVSQVDVSFENNEAVVEYDPAQVDPAVLVVAVTEIGFEAALKKSDEPETEATQEPETAPD